MFIRDKQIRDNESRLYFILPKETGVFVLRMCTGAYFSSLFEIDHVAYTDLSVHPYYRGRPTISDKQAWAISVDQDMLFLELPGKISVDDKLMVFFPVYLRKLD